MAGELELRDRILETYPDVLTPAALGALAALAPLDAERRELMAKRIAVRAARAREKRRIEFLDPESTIPRTSIRVADARAGNFEGCEIPPDLRRQWIQGTGPATKPPNCAVVSQP